MKSRSRNSLRTPKAKAQSDPVPLSDSRDGSTSMESPPCTPADDSSGHVKPSKTKRQKTVTEQVTTAQTTYVVNELLAYIMFHYMQCTENDIKQVILDFYDPHTINDAKRAIWEHCGEHLPPFEARRNSPVGGSVQEKDVNDIMFAVKEMDRRDTSETTVFVATRLDGLPRVTPGEVDPISLLERVTLLETSRCVTSSNALHGTTRRWQP